MREREKKTYCKAIKITPRNGAFSSVRSFFPSFFLSLGVIIKFRMGIQAGGWGVGVGALFLSLCPFEKDKNMADGQHSLGLCALISYLNTKRPMRQTENDESTGVVYFSCVCV